ATRAGTSLPRFIVPSSPTALRLSSQRCISGSPLGVEAHRGVKVLPGEGGPHRWDHVDLCATGLPREEAGEPVIATRPDDQIDLLQRPAGQGGRDHLVIN